MYREIETMEQNRFPIGTIVKARYTYGSEVQYWKLYKIIGYTATRVKFIEIETKSVYDDGKDGPHYYDAPRHCEPVMYFGQYNEVGDPKTKSYKFSTYDGEMRFSPEEFYYVCGEYKPGEYLEEYNYH